MHASELTAEKYPYQSTIRLGSEVYLIAFSEVNAISVFRHTDYDNVTPYGSIDCTKEVSGELEIAVAKRSHELLHEVAHANSSHLLRELKSCLATSLATANRLKQSQPSRELSLAITKLEEAEMWLRKMK